MVKMPELKVQHIGKSLYVCIPTDVLRANPEKGFPPLDIDKGDVMTATRTRAGILYEPIRSSGSTWMLMPER